MNITEKSLQTLNDETEAGRNDSFQNDLRESVLQAIDMVVEEHGKSALTDSHLPELFKCIDAIAAKL